MKTIKLVCILLVVTLATSCAPPGTSKREVLHKNVKHQDLQKLKENIEAGKDINQKDWYGYTPLILAAYYGYGQMVEYLCEKGADRDAQNNEGWSALLYAVYYGYEETFNILMNYGPNVNLANNQGYTALSYAKEFNREMMTQKLKEAGAKMNSE